jgi:sugar phosphate isomerase/epimerase
LQVTRGLTEAAGNSPRPVPADDGSRRAGAFCELGTGEVDLDSFLAELDGYAGWLVVEQDWVQFEAQRGTVPGSPSTPDLSPSA